MKLARQQNGLEFYIPIVWPNGGLDQLPKVGRRCSYGSTTRQWRGLRVDTPMPNEKGWVERTCGRRRPEDLGRCSGSWTGEGPLSLAAGDPSEQSAIRGYSKRGIDVNFQIEAAPPTAHGYSLAFQNRQSVRARVSFAHQSTRVEWRNPLCQSKVLPIRTRVGAFEWHAWSCNYGQNSFG
jgi:hypothetical protein